MSMSYVKTSFLQDIELQKSILRFQKVKRNLLIHHNKPIKE